jgi:hypothetical protein
MKSSFYGLIPFLPLFCNCQLNSFSPLPGSYPGRMASRISTPFSSTELFFITALHGPRRKHGSGSYLIVACVFIAAGLCFPSRCLAMNVYCDFTIPAFGRHVNRFIVGLPELPSNDLLVFSPTEIAVAT